MQRLPARMHVGHGRHVAVRPARPCARPARQHKYLTCAAAGDSEAPSAPSARVRAVPVPSTPEAQTVQAVQACLAAYRQGGLKRQRLELLLPLIGATDLDDWPGGIRQQFKAAAPLVESILKGLKQSEEALAGPLQAEIWDQGDAVGCWCGDKMAAVLFPTASTMKRLQELAAAPGLELLLIINPQWELEGNLMNDFGFGASRQRALDFIASFPYAYHLTQQRVYGDEARLLRAYPGQWQVYGVAGRQGETELVASPPDKPSYKEVEAALRAWPRSQTRKSLLDRLQDEWAWNRDNLQ